MEKKNSLFPTRKSFLSSNLIELPYDDLKTETISGKRHYVTPNGDKYQSITSKLGDYYGHKLDGWKNAVGEEEVKRVSRIAASRGTGVHDALERYIRGEAVGELMPDERPSFSAIRKVLDRHVDDILLLESPLYSDYLKTAGRVDLVARFDGEIAICDFKTSNRVKKHEDIESYFIQATAYSLMVTEQTKQEIHNLCVIMAIDGKKDAVVFHEKRDKWIKPLMKVINASKNYQG